MEERIVLRPATVEDVETIYKWWTDGRIMQSVGYPKGLETTSNQILEAIYAYKVRNSEFLIIVFDASHRIGEFAYREVSEGTYSFDIKIGEYDMQGKGYGKEALKQGIERIKSISNAERIEISVDSENRRALNLYKSFGFSTIRKMKNSWKDQLDNYRSAEILELKL